MPQKSKQKKNFTKRKNFNLCLVKIIGIDVFLNVLQKEGATEIFTLSYGGSVGKNTYLSKAFKTMTFANEK